MRTEAHNSVKLVKLLISDDMTEGRDKVERVSGQHMLINKNYTISQQDELYNAVRRHAFV